MQDSQACHVSFVSGLVSHGRASRRRTRRARKRRAAHATGGSSPRAAFAARRASMVSSAERVAAKVASRCASVSGRFDAAVDATSSVADSVAAARGAAAGSSVKIESVSLLAGSSHRAFVTAALDIFALLRASSPSPKPLRMSPKSMKLRSGAGVRNNFVSAERARKYVAPAVEWKAVNQ